MNDLPDFDTATSANGSEPPKRQRGRPPGSKNKARKAAKKVAVARGRPPGRPPAAILPIAASGGGAAPQLVANAVNAITALSEEGRKYVIAIIAGMNK